MIEKIWDAYPTPVNPREAPWETYPRRGRKGGRHRSRELAKALAKAALRILLAALLLLGTLFPRRW